MDKISLRLLVVTGFLFAFAATGCQGSQNAVFQPGISKLLDKAKQLQQSGQMGPAICRLEAAADIAPDMGPVQYNLGVLYTQDAHYQKAVQHLEKSVKLAPNDINSYFSLGYAYAALGDKIRAAIPASPTSPKPKTTSACENTVESDADLTAMTSEAAYEKAIAAYTAFLEKAPKDDPGIQQAQDERDRLTALQKPLQ